MIYVRKEGREDIVAYEELYYELVQKYKSLDYPLEIFEWNFIGECAWIPRAIASVKNRYLLSAVSFERDYMGFFINHLCKMESELLRLEKEIEIGNRTL